MEVLYSVSLLIRFRLPMRCGLCFHVFEADMGVKDGQTVSC
jgi:hypothetical protein